MQLKTKTIYHYLTLFMAHHNLEPWLGKENVSINNLLFHLFLCNIASRFTNQGRVSAAVHDYNLADSPSRINPNKALLREREGASDHNQEAAYRRENYEIFRRNLEEAFN